MHCLETKISLDWGMTKFDLFFRLESSTWNHVESLNESLNVSFRYELMDA